MQENNRLVTWIAAVLVLAVIVFAAYLVTLVTQPAVAVGVLTAFAAVLAALPAVIKAIRGGE